VKTLEEMTPQELLRWMLETQREQGEMLRSMRKHLIVIAIPFWLTLCSVLAGLLFLVASYGLFTTL
jgi:hypothetical protein